jgi:hypothetical protein
MTDIVITPGSVVPGTNAVIEHGWAGETLAAGKVVYRADSVDGRYKLADSNVDSPAEIHTPRGIALNGASVGQPVTILRSGPVTIGGTLVANTAYYLSDTPGGICPVADVGTQEYPTVLGMSTSTTVLDVDIQTSGGEIP